MTVFRVGSRLLFTIIYDSCEAVLASQFGDSEFAGIHPVIAVITPCAFKKAFHLC
jgi:hypothetical protein